MNEELQKAIAELFNSALSAKDFLVGELPEYIEQLLMWNAIFSLIWFLFGFLCLFVTINLFKRTRDYFGRKIYDIEREKQDAREAKDRGESWCFYPGSTTITSCEYDRILRKMAPTFSEEKVFLNLGCISCGFISFLFVSLNLDWLQIWIAPKVWLVEYAASLVK